MTLVLILILIRRQRASLRVAATGRGQGQSGLDTDRLYCTLPVMEACEQVKTSFVIRQHAKPPRLIQEGEWQAPVPVATGTVHEQTIEVN